MAKIELTQGQIESLRDFIECEFITSIRNDAELDNINYVVNICDIYKELKKAQKKEENL